MTNNKKKQLIRQVACSQGGLWRLEAEAVLEVEQVEGPMGRREARFSAIEGDFSYLTGRWVVEPDAGRSSGGHATILRYDIAVQPRIPIPSSIVSYIVRAGLPANIKSIVERAEALAERRLRASGLASWAGVEEEVDISSLQTGGSDGSEDSNGAAQASSSQAQKQQRQGGQSSETNAMLPSKGPFWSVRGSPYPEVAPLTAEQQRRQAAKSAAQSAYLGTAFVPLPPAGRPEASIQRALDDQLREKQQDLYPAFGLRRSADYYFASMDSVDDDSSSSYASSPTGKSNNSTSNGSNTTNMNGSGSGSGSAASRAATILKTAPYEVHLRRLDGLDYLHRRAVAAVTVDAPAADVWSVLTDYNHLADFIPNLVASERIQLPPTAPNNIVRIRQVGYKRMMYMSLHAETVLDLIEKPTSEIQFRQVAGDFERFQGKFMLSEGPADPELAGQGYTGPQTQLKYAVELMIPKSGRMLGVIEPVLERVVFEDAPANLAAIKKKVEELVMERKAQALERAGDRGQAAAFREKSQRPKLSEMMDDFVLLETELERCYGDQRIIPTRDTMRESNRTDLEKAITSHGGPSVVAQRMGWKLQVKPRKPKGYWDSLLNVKTEIDEFIVENGLERGVMPVKNEFIRAGRFDLARAVERWGGLYELANELGYGSTGGSMSGDGNGTKKGGVVGMAGVREEIDAW